MGISEVSESGQIDSPDFSCAPHTRTESYGAPGSVVLVSLYGAQRVLLL